MGEIIEKLADFVTTARFSDLPEEAVHEMKRVVLDSIGCALAGHVIGKGQAAARLAARLGGTPESTIIGTNDKVSCTNAALANGELINALDNDALPRTKSGPVAHDFPILVPPPLAMAESTRASGEDLILALALGTELSVRLRSAEKGRPPIADGPDRGKLHWPMVHGYSAVSLGAAAAAGKILDLDRENMANAIGIAGCIAPPNLVRKWMVTAPARSTKYGPSGWGAQAGISAALLADMGYTGDTDVLEGEYGFWRFTGHDSWKVEGILDGLGEEWQCHYVHYKQYPCGL